MAASRSLLIFVHSHTYCEYFPKGLHGLTFMEVLCQRKVIVCSFPSTLTWQAGPSPSGATKDLSELESRLWVELQ